MWKGVVIIVSGICSCLSFSMGFLAFRFGDSGAFLFAGFGLFSGAFFIVSTMRLLAEKGMYRKEIPDTISRYPNPVSFVPHRFILSALIVTVIAVLAAIIISIFQGT